MLTRSKRGQEYDRFRNAASPLHFSTTLASFGTNLGDTYVFALRGVYGKRQTGYFGSVLDSSSGF